jgi:hypothetical protein
MTCRFDRLRRAATGRQAIQRDFLAENADDLQRMIDSTPESNCGMMTTRIMTAWMMKARFGGILAA